MILKGAAGRKKRKEGSGGTPYFRDKMIVWEELLWILE